MAAAPFLLLVVDDSKVAGRGVLSMCVRPREFVDGTFHRRWYRYIVAPYLEIRGGNARAIFVSRQGQIMMSWWHLLELVSLVLAILALVAGVVHLLELRKTAEALSTRYIGKFPLFLSTIVDMIDAAQKDIIIFCDVAGYGAFTDPSSGLAYRQALERQVQRGCRVELTCMTAERRNQEALEALNETNWEKWKEEHVRDVVRYLSAHSSVANPAGLSREQFVTAMSDADDEIMNHLFRQNMMQLSADMPI